MPQDCNHECLICRIKAEVLAEITARMNPGQALLQPRHPASALPTPKQKKRGGPGRGLSDDERELIKKLKGQGRTHTEIADELGVSKTTIGRVVGTIPDYQRRRPGV